MKNGYIGTVLIKGHHAKVLNSQGEVTELFRLPFQVVGRPSKKR